ncbi:MAG: hypothetical protein NTV36_01760 [Candidatus Staskawiczbacteria bacterium]|nr:hypothetical protein [Candidatus Staskawiczbacteria bacterium]
MDFHVYLEKLRNLPEMQKKIVLWVIVALLGIIMGFFWVKGAMNNLNKISQSVSQIEFPDIQPPVDTTNKINK